MKKLMIATASASVLLLSGCGGGGQMDMMKDHINAIEAEAAMAKEMAAEALSKATHNHMHMKKMMGHKMMK